MKTQFVILAVAAALSAPAVASAHFILHSPASHLTENRLGDPQKAFPCGENDAIKGTATNTVSEVMGGELMHLKVQETIYHPGFYRVALAVNDLKELPKDPEPVTRDGPRGPISVSAKYDLKAKAPILSDGLFVHNTKVDAGAFSEAEIKIPNINCKGCVIQVVQFMAEHGLNTPGDFTYHHCAVVNITATPKMPIDKAWPKQTRTIASLIGPPYVKPAIAMAAPAAPATTAAPTTQTR
jgi:hypothetical protein